MRVKGTGDGTEAVPPVDASAPPDPADPADPVERTAAVAPSAAPEGAIAADAIAGIARRLKGGEISAGEAVELLIDEVVERGPGAPLAASRELAEELKQLLRRQVEADPYLAARVQRVGRRT